MSQKSIAAKETADNTVCDIRRLNRVGSAWHPARALTLGIAVYRGTLVEILAAKATRLSTGTNLDPTDCITFLANLRP